MQPQGCPTAQQLEFLLEDIFLIQPNPASKYKLRILINGKDTLHHPKYIVHPPYYTNTRISVFLLESNAGGTHEIGKGEIDISSLLKVPQNSIHVQGIIYGNRSVNYGKILAKCKYEIIKKKVPRRKAIEEQSEQINRKLNQLAKKLQDEESQMQNKIIYKYNEKFTFLVDTDSNYAVTLNNIKICSPKQPSTELQSKRTLIETPKLVEIIILEVLSDSYKREVVSMLLPINYGIDNKKWVNPINLPETTNKLLLKVIESEGRTLSSTFTLTGKHQILELFNEQNQEEGYVHFLLHQGTACPSYFHQLHQYQALRRDIPMRKLSNSAYKRESRMQRAKSQHSEQKDQWNRHSRRPVSRNLRESVALKQRETEQKLPMILSRRNSKSIGYSLSIRNASVNLYEDSNTAKYIRFEVDQAKSDTPVSKETKHLSWRNLSIVFRNIALSSQLRMSCWSTANHREVCLGQCSVQLQELNYLEKQEYRAFLIHRNEIIGYLMISLQIESDAGKSLLKHTAANPEGQLDLSIQSSRIFSRIIRKQSRSRIHDEHSFNQSRRS